MDYSKPTLLVISGPNGAGKSTHIQTMLPVELSNVWSFDRDKARTNFESYLSADGKKYISVAKEAMEMMENVLYQEMLLAIGKKSHFVLETPLSHPDYWKYIDLFETNGYQIQLNYLCLDKITDCIARVGQRVLEGGHYVAPNTVRGVYNKNLEHVNGYRKTFKIIELYDGMKIPVLIAKIENEQVIYADPASLKKGWVKLGLPLIYSQIKDFLALH